VRKRVELGKKKASLFNRRVLYVGWTMYLSVFCSHLEKMRNYCHRKVRFSVSESKERKNTANRGHWMELTSLPSSSFILSPFHLFAVLSWILCHMNHTNHLH